jgi:NodT family efflux transporter outer membrane factor (OMF) lipoprotein
MNKLLRSALLGASTLAIAACSTEPPTALKSEEMPQAYASPVPQGATAWPASDWWSGFSSTELTGLEVSAQQNNLDLAAAAARVMQARGNSGIAAAALFPAVDLQSSAQRGASSTPLPNGGHVVSTGNSFGLSLNASYELDFWGLAQDNLHAAQNSARAALYAQRVVALTVTSEVADTYFDVLALRERVSIAKNNLEAAKRVLGIIEAKVTNGVSSNLDLAQQRAVVASVEAAIPALEEQEREARYALAVLQGRAPEGFDVKGQTLEGLVPPTVVPGIPSALLARRPDIAEAEANLVAAHASLDAARAAFLPAIGLTGSGGYAGSQLSNLINPSNLAWTIGASLLQTVFDGGLKTSQRDVARGQEMELMATYRSTVFNALSDVESSLGQVSSLAKQEQYTTEQVKNAAEAFRISELQYREGVADLLAVLQSQQTLFTGQDTLVQIKLARLQSNISLYRALGGGWTVDQDKDAPTRNEFQPVPLLSIGDMIKG